MDPAEGEGDEGTGAARVEVGVELEGVLRGVEMVEEG